MMTKPAQEIQHLNIAVLPILMPLSQAALVTGMDVATLREMVAQGKVMAGTSLDGCVLVAIREGKVVMLENGLANGQATGNGEAHEHEGDVFELNRRLAQIRREQFKHLKGRPIRLGEAERKYGISGSTLHKWAKRGYISVLERAPKKMVLDEGDVAFCVAIYKIRKEFGSRAPLLDSNGQPYLLKRPDLAIERRLKR